MLGLDLTMNWIHFSYVAIYNVISREDYHHYRDSTVIEFDWWPSIRLEDIELIKWVKLVFIFKHLLIHQDLPNLLTLCCIPFTLKPGTTCNWYDQCFFCMQIKSHGRQIAFLSESFLYQYVQLFRGNSAAGAHLPTNRHDMNIRRLELV